MGRATAIIEAAVGKFHLPPDFSKRIKNLRSKFNITQKRLAEILGASTTSVKLWEQGRASPPIDSWQQIVLAEAEGIQVLEIGEFSPEEGVG